MRGWAPHGLDISQVKLETRLFDKIHFLGVTLDKTSVKRICHIGGSNLASPSKGDSRTWGDEQHQRKLRRRASLRQDSARWRESTFSTRGDLWGVVSVQEVLCAAAQKSAVKEGDTHSTWLHPIHHASQSEGRAALPKHLSHLKC